MSTEHTPAPARIWTNMEGVWHHHHLFGAGVSPEVEYVRADLAEGLAQALERVESWTQAYPLDVFPEPDLKRARELLAAGGITIDAVSASAFRHVLNGLDRIVAEPLATWRAATESTPEDR